MGRGTLASVGGASETRLGCMPFAFLESSQYIHMAIGLQPQTGGCCTYVEQGQHPMWMPHLTAQNVALGWVIQGASTQ